MIKISEVVKNIVFSSVGDLVSLREGYMNLSKYALLIKAEVEKKAKKPVKTGSIVVALSRLQKELKKQPPFLPKVELKDLSVKSGLNEIVYEKTAENIKRIQKLWEDKEIVFADFLAVTYGINQINIIASKEAQTKIFQIFKGIKPEIIVKNLVGLTVRFDKSYLRIPNILFLIISRLASKRINIIEIISTYTELTFILDEKDLREAFLTLNVLLKPTTRP